MQQQRLQQTVQRQLRALQERQQQQRARQRQQEADNESENIEKDQDKKGPVQENARAGTESSGLLLLRCGGADDRRRAVDCVETFRVSAPALQREAESSSSIHSTAASSPQTGSLSSSPSSSLQHRQHQCANNLDKKDLPFFQLDEHLPPLQVPRYAHVACATSEDEVLVVGGREEGEGVLRSVERFRFSQRSWSSLPSLHSARAHHAGCVVWGGRAVVIGGEGDRGGVLRSVELFHPVRGNWINLPPLQHQRHSFAAVAVGCCVVVLGGRDGPGDHGRVLRSVEGFTLSSPGAASLSASGAAGGGGVAGTASSSPSFCSSSAAAVTRENRSSRFSNTEQQQLDAAGTAGLEASGGEADAEEREEAAADAAAGGHTVRLQQQQQAGLRWACRRAQSESDAAAAAGAAVARVSAETAPGGSSGSSSCCCSNRSSVENCWRLLPSMRQARASCGAAQYRSFIFCAGGTNGVKPLASVEVFDTRTGIWSDLPALNEPRVSPLCLVWLFQGDNPFSLRQTLLQQQHRLRQPEDEDETQQQEGCTHYPVLCVAGGRRSALHGVLASVEFLDLRPYLQQQQDVLWGAEKDQQQRHEFGEGEGDETSAAWVLMPDAGAKLLWQSAAALLRDPVERKLMEPTVCPSLETLASVAAGAGTPATAGARRAPGFSSDALLLPTLPRLNSSNNCGSSGTTSSSHRHPLAQPGIRRTLPHTIVGVGTNSSSSTCGAAAAAGATQQGNATMSTRRVSFTTAASAAGQPPYSRSQSSNDSSVSRAAAVSAADLPMRRSLTSQAAAVARRPAGADKPTSAEGTGSTAAATPTRAAVGASSAAARASTDSTAACGAAVAASAEGVPTSATTKPRAARGEASAATAGAPAPAAGAAAKLRGTAAAGGAPAADRGQQPCEAVQQQRAPVRGDSGVAAAAATEAENEKEQADDVDSNSSCVRQQQQQLSRVHNRCSSPALGAHFSRSSSSNSKGGHTQPLGSEQSSRTSRVQMLRQKLEAQQVKRLAERSAANRRRAAAAANGVSQSRGYSLGEDTDAEEQLHDPLGWLAS